MSDGLEIGIRTYVIGLVDFTLALRSQNDINDNQPYIQTDILF